MKKDEKPVQEKDVQKKYKDTVFRMLFGKEERALSLYNGVNGTDYKDASSLKFNTLENAVFMNVKNDLSFVFASSVNLYEHQSTVPVNMPLRDLFYIADVWKKEFMDKSIYSNKRTVMPNPNFVVFYNGVRELPEQMEMKLSDSLMEQKAEVIKMSIYEFDEEKVMAIIRADERELGREEGEHRITELHKRLLDDERMEDLRKAVEDDSYQSALCREYGI